MDVTVIETPPRERSATHPPATPERPNRGRQPPEQRLYVPLKGVRRKLFGPTKKCFKCKHKVEERMAVEVVPVGKTIADAVSACPRCALCPSCLTMRPVPGGGQESYVVDKEGTVMHLKCMRCSECNKVDPMKECTAWETGMVHRECLKNLGNAHRIAGLSIGK